ncbi:ANTAR domain-containing protein [Nakamurella endophytica]|uniref:ANTAR domain-containing protein n=1 Tax=Nakamurella endophytica TaxID=1748367 RepID=A0A917T633_9ACTN|nr:ANTAR domain-containing protein [Nakamurella endophytica]GGM10659.1 hypothetical protein GCM10011594_33240 [Nakamurella endophytica]
MSADDRGLVEALRQALGNRPEVRDDGGAAAAIRVDSALSVVGTLLELGWMPPGELTDALVVAGAQELEHGVRRGAAPRTADAADPQGDPDPHGSTPVAAVDDIAQLAGAVDRDEAVRSLTEDLATTRAHLVRVTEDFRRSRARMRAVRERAARMQELARSTRRAATPARTDDIGTDGGRATSPDVDAPRRQTSEQRLEQQVAQLRDALAHRPETEHVVGMLMFLLGCDRDTAWSVLVQVSQLSNRKVRDIAAAVVAHVVDGHPLDAQLSGLLRDAAGPVSGNRSGRSDLAPPFRGR